jgi:HSP20 family protein
MTDQSHGEKTNIPVSSGEDRESERHPRGLTRRGGEESASAMSPFSFMRRFSEDMDRLFEEFGLGRIHSIPRFWSTGGEIARAGFGRGSWSPAIEMFERGDELVLRAELPGMRKEDIKVECRRDAVTIEGERRQEHTEERGGRFHTERSYGRFYRSIPLPEGVKTEDATASFRDGVLEVVLKSAEESRSHRIDIQT